MIAAALWACGPAPARADWVRILHADKDAAQARVDLVQQARREIDIACYSVSDDNFPLVLLGLLRDAARRGVAVRLLVDGHDADNVMPRALEAYLLREGVEIRVFNPPGDIGRRLHDKLMVVDGRQWIVGGRNLKNRHFGLDCRNYVDRDVYIRGDSAREATCYFMARWTSCGVAPPCLGGKLPKKVPEKQAHPELDDACDEAAIRQAGALVDEARRAMAKCGFVRFDTGRDWSAGAYPVSCVRFLHDIPGVSKEAAGIGPDMLALLANAQSSLVLETPFAAFSRRMLRTLAGLRLRGVRVILLTNSVQTSNREAAQAAYENRKRWLLRHGIELWELHGCEILHAKAAILDGSTAVIGSYNFDVLSQRRNSEVAAVIDSPEVAASLWESFLLHLEKASPIGRNARPLGYTTRYPGADRHQRRQIRRDRAIAPLIKPFL